LEDKIKLRLNLLPNKKEIRVIDAYSGKGTIWKNIQKRTESKILILKIDKEKKQNDFMLLGENEKFLSSLDLNKFDVIDLDAYGVPYEQLKIIFEKKYRGVVFVTFIQSIMGRLPNDFLIDCGYTLQMINKCPTLFGRKGWTLFKNWLSSHGIKKINYRCHARKHYLSFMI
jgi:spore coat polysaccharide biosynthesis predicted glycosyltransferase SpsG